MCQEEDEYTLPLRAISVPPSQMPRIILEHALLAEDWHFQTCFSPLSESISVHILPSVTFMLFLVLIYVS